MEGVDFDFYWRFYVEKERMDNPFPVQVFIDDF
jgi:hypothetical protein